MDVDMPLSNSKEYENSVDNGKYGNLKAFVAAARDFEANHSEASINLLNRYLGVSSCLQKFIHKCSAHIFSIKIIYIKNKFI